MWEWNPCAGFPQSSMQWMDATSGWRLHHTFRAYCAHISHLLPLHGRRRAHFVLCTLRRCLEIVRHTNFASELCGIERCRVDRKKTGLEALALTTTHYYRWLLALLGYSLLCWMKLCCCHFSKRGSCNASAVLQSVSNILCCVFKHSSN